MISEKIANVTTSYSGNTCAISGFISSFSSKRLTKTFIVDLNKSIMIRSFYTGLEDLGGHRSSITIDNRLFVTAGDFGNGVALYSIENEQKLWHRRDLNKASKVSFTQNNNIYVFFNDKPCLLIDGVTGDTIQSTKGIRNIWESPYEDINLIDYGVSKEYYSILVRGKDEIICKIPRKSFAVLSVSFTKNTVFISESEKSLSGYSTHTGKLLWEYKSGYENHVIKHSYNLKGDYLSAIDFSYMKTGKLKLVTLSMSGNVIREKEFEKARKFSFALSGSVIVTSLLEILDSFSGEIVSMIEA